MMNVMELTFKECKECTAKPSAPILCSTCLHNRDVIAQLKREVEMLRKTASSPAAGNDELLTAPKVAALLQCDLKTVHNWANNGKIKYFRTPGRHLRFLTSDVHEFMESRGFPVPKAKKTDDGDMCDYEKWHVHSEDD